LRFSENRCGLLRTPFDGYRIVAITIAGRPGLTIGSSEFLREIHPDLKILLPRQGQRVTNAPASCCRVWAAP
jgi:hypothetical protein